MYNTELSYEQWKRERRKAAHGEFRYRPSKIFYNGYFIAFMFCIFYPAAIIMLVHRKKDIERQKEEYNKWKTYILSMKPDLKVMVRKDEKFVNTTKSLIDFINSSEYNYNVSAISNRHEMNRAKKRELFGKQR